MSIRDWGRRLYELWDPWASKQHLHSRLVASLDTIDDVRMVLRKAGVDVDGRSIVEAVRSLAADRDVKAREIAKLHREQGEVLAAIPDLQQDPYDEPAAAVAKLAGRYEHERDERRKAEQETADVHRLYGELERSHAQLREAHEGLRRRSEAGSVDAQKLRRRWDEVCDIVNRPMD